MPQRRTAAACSVAVVALAGFVAEAAGVPADRGLLRLAGRHVKWGEPAYGSEACVTYAFLDRPRRFDGARNCAEMEPLDALLARSSISPVAFAREVQAAFALWAAAADLRFRRVADPERADILIGGQRGGRGVAFTNIREGGRGRGPIDGIGQATICLDPSERWEVGIDGDPKTYNLRYVAAHEIGHAIGLDHLGREGGVMGFAYRELIRSPAELRLAPGDVAAVARLYGPAGGTSPTEASASAAARLPSSCSTPVGGAGGGTACGLVAGGT